MRARLKLTKNMTIVGPPGSGKGFYGLPLASYFDVPLWTVSTILRKSVPKLDTASGKLVECRTVSNVLQKFFATQGAGTHYILDGFPRTSEQIKLMELHWPIQNQVHCCLQLDVPDSVCEQKMLGRRLCQKCHRQWNIADVRMLGFDLPPQIPGQGKRQSKEGIACNCDPGVDWTRRDDDTPEIIRERLRLYREHEAPILDFYKSQGRFLRFTPFRGELDIPRLQSTVDLWLQSFNVKGH